MFVFLFPNMNSLLPALGEPCAEQPRVRTLEVRVRTDVQCHRVSPTADLEKLQLAARPHSVRERDARVSPRHVAR